jgi:hypothetical protein
MMCPQVYSILKQHTCQLTYCCSNCRSQVKGCIGKDTLGLLGLTKSMGSDDVRKAAEISNQMKADFLIKKLQAHVKMAHTRTPFSQPASGETQI